MLWARTGVRPHVVTLADLGSRPDHTGLWVSASSYGPGSQKRLVSWGRTVQDGAREDLGSILGQALGLPRPWLPINKMRCWSSGSTNP